MQLQLLRELRHWDGVIPTSALIEVGWTYRQIQALCSRGELSRIRPGLVAAPSADAELVRAARHSGAITCVTQARRLGLWVTSEDPRLHLGLRPNARKPADPALKLHWRAPLIERDVRQLQDHLVNVLAAVAECVPEEDAFAVLESALNKRLIESAELRRLPLTGFARELAETAMALSDSGLESLVRWRLRRFNLHLRAQAWILGHHVDLLIGERLVLQIDGGTHVGKQRTSDIAHDARLMVNGYHVIRVGYDQLVNNWPEVQDLILRAVAQGLASA